MTVHPPDAVDSYINRRHLPCNWRIGFSPSVCTIFLISWRPRQRSMWKTQTLIGYIHNLQRIDRFSFSATKHTALLWPNFHYNCTAPRMKDTKRRNYFEPDLLGLPTRPNSDGSDKSATARVFELTDVRCVFGGAHDESDLPQMMIDRKPGGKTVRLTRSADSRWTGKQYRKVLARKTIWRCELWASCHTNMFVERWELVFLEEVYLNLGEMESYNVTTLVHAPFTLSFGRQTYALSWPNDRFAWIPGRCHLEPV